MLIKKLKILVVPSDRTGVSYYRSTTPHVVLEENYPNEFSIDIDYHPDLNNDTFLKQYDIIHYHRTLGNPEEMGELVTRLKKLGIISIMDLDDYWDVGTHHPMYQIVKNANLAQKILNNIKVADNVTTTTTIFADEIKKHNKNVYILPNAINPNEKQYIPNPEPSERLRIGWLGGSSHLKDLEILDGVVSSLGPDLMNKVQFVLCGFDLRGTMTFIDSTTKKETQRPIKPMESVWYQYEKIFTNNYQSVSPEYKEFLLKFKNEEYPNVANEPYRRVWTKPITTYAFNYNLFDVSLAPLQENIFNKVKSQLKIIEAGFHKKAVIAQDFGPYKIDLINANVFGGGINPDGNGILIDSVKNHKDWTKNIKRLIESPELVKQLSENLFNTVSPNYSINKGAKMRRDLYRSLYITKKVNINK